MKVQKITKRLGSMAALIALLLILPFMGVLSGAEIPSVEDVIKGKALAPTIEELTMGKVKGGDLINKDNVDLVKEYLTPGVYASVKRGLVMRMSTLNFPPEKLLPKTFRDATERTRGKAVMDENGTVFYENIGTLWPGGLPYPEPKTGMEVMANVKYGRVWDEWVTDPNVIRFVNSDGKPYKRTIMKQMYIQCTTRTRVPPLGMIEGYEDIMWKRVSVMIYPQEIKGLGQYTERHYDDAKNHDTGYAYLPSFKRTIRVSAVTWQDNIGGGDLTYGDGFGLQEPYSYWTFKLTGVKYLLHPNNPYETFEFIDRDGDLNEKAEFDAGQKFLRSDWVIIPAHEVEAVPNIKHIYGKKILYCQAWPYWPSWTPFNLVDMYDRQMKPWKTWIAAKGMVLFNNGGEMVGGNSVTMTYDLQADHMTQFLLRMKIDDMNYKAKDITLQSLLKWSR